MSEDRKVIGGEVFLLVGFARNAKERDALKKKLKLKYKHVRVFPPRFTSDSYRLFADERIPKQAKGWYVTLKGDWYMIVNAGTGRSKKIGKISGRGINYFDKAMEEAQRRNKDGKRPRYLPRG